LRSSDQPLSRVRIGSTFLVSVEDDSLSKAMPPLRESGHQYAIINT
jgi:hypothetical protein